MWTISNVCLSVWTKVNTPQLYIRPHTHPGLFMKLTFTAGLCFLSQSSAIIQQTMIMSQFTLMANSIYSNGGGKWRKATYSNNLPQRNRWCSCCHCFPDEGAGKPLLQTDESNQLCNYYKWVCVSDQHCRPGDCLTSAESTEWKEWGRLNHTVRKIQQLQHASLYQPAVIYNNYTMSIL